MCAVRVAAVSRDEGARLELARAFDAAPTHWHVALHTEVPESADVVVFGPDVEAGEGIVFDPNEPAELIGSITSALAATARSNLIVITGTGGGVGVTTVALHLAMNAARDRSACCIGGSGTAFRLDLPPDVPKWSDDDSRIDRVAAPVAGGFRVVIATADAAAAIDAARSDFDAVFLDGARPEANTLASARAVVLVLPPSVPGARAAAELVHEYPDVRWALVTNRLGPGGEMTRVALEQILGRRIAVELPTCAPLRDVEDDARLLTSVLYRWPRKVAQLWNTLDRS